MMTKYDDNIIKYYRNSNFIQQEWKPGFYSKLKESLVRRTFPIVSICLFIRYILCDIIFIVVYSEENMTINNPSNTSEPKIMYFLSEHDDNKSSREWCSEYIDDNVGWIENEKNMRSPKCETGER